MSGRFDHFVCEAEIGRLGAWRTCLRRAAWRIGVERRDGPFFVYYCERHVGHAGDPEHLAGPVTVRHRLTD